MAAAEVDNKIVQLSKTLGDLIDLITEETPLTEGFEEEIESIKPELRSLLILLEAVESGDGEEETEEQKSLVASIKEVALLAKTQIDAFISIQQNQMKNGKFNKFISTLGDAKARSGFTKTLKMIKVCVPEIIELLKKVMEEAESSSSEEEVVHQQQAPSRGINIIGRREDMARVKSLLSSGFSNQFDDFDVPSSQKSNRPSHLSENAQALMHHIGNYFGIGPASSRGFQQKVQLSAVSIVGIEGVGKTTLASSIYKDTYIARIFSIRAWVKMPHEFHPEEILCSIAKQVGSDEPDKRWSLAMLTESLQFSLAEKSYLLVLDDVQTTEAWRLLRQVLPCNGHCKVLITTRVAEVATEASSSSGSIHHLQMLTQQNSWLLFRTVLRDAPDELLPVAQKMVESCRGIPLLILETAGILLWEEKTVEHWSSLLSELQQKGSLKHLIGDALPSYLKKCLYSLLIFDKNFEIPIRRLVALWIAEGFVLPTLGNVDKPLEDIAKEYLLDLSKYFVIEVLSKKSNGEINTCRIRTAIRSILILKAKLYNFFIEHGSKRVYRLAHHPQTTDTNNCDNDDIWSLYVLSSGSSTSYCFKYLRAFSSFDPREGPDPGEQVKNFLHRGIKMGGCKRLRILDLEGVFRPILPKVLFKELKQLRYLSLRRTYAEVLPSSIGSLRRLHFLDLKHTCISTVPVSIWKLEELRHLYLSQSYRSRFPSHPSLSKFIKNLQTFSGGFIDDQSLIENGLDRLKNLRKLALTCQMSMEKQKELGNWILKSTGLETLRLRSIDEMVEPSQLYLEDISGLTRLNNLYLIGVVIDTAGTLLSRLPESLTEITLSLSKLTLDPMPVLGGLPNLRSLSLLSDSYIGNSMTCPTSSFPKLCYLKLWKLTELEEWKVEGGAMSAIEAIEIRSCSKLKSIPRAMEYLTSFQ